MWRLSSPLLPPSPSAAVLLLLLLLLLLHSLSRGVTDVRKARWGQQTGGEKTGGDSFGWCEACKLANSQFMSRHSRPVRIAR